MRLLVLKNLTAHKMRNKMTSIIFSLALGFIVFLIVSYNLQITSSSLLNLMSRGSYLVLSTNAVGVIDPQMFDPILSRHMDTIKSFSYVASQLSRLPSANIKALQVSDRARINLVNVGVYGVMPSMFDSTVSDFLDINYAQSPLLTGTKLAEQLYTARGS